MEKLYEIFSKNIFPSDPETGTLGAIDLNTDLIQCAGIPLFDAKKKSKCFKILMPIYSIIIMTIVTLAYFSFEMHDLALCWRNLDELTQNACMSLTHVAGTIKIINVLYRRKDILRIINQFKYLAKKYVISKKQKEAFYWGEFENKITLTIYLSIVVFTGMLAVIRLMLNPTEIAGKLFPFRVKMPEFIPCTIQIVYMSVAVFVYATQVIGVDYLNVNLVNQIRYQMKILNIAFDSLAVTDEIDNMDGNKYINTIVEHHNLILGIREEIESIFKFPLLIQFCASLLITAVSGFQATVQSDSSSTILTNLYCGCICFELFVYCWFGNEVSEQTNTLASRGYNSLWYNFDERYKKSLIIFLVNAQRPFYFTAGGLFELSLVTFSRILSKSYTCIALLRQLYAEK